MKNRTWLLCMALVAVGMTGCKWDDSLYTAYVGKDERISLCPVVCMDPITEELAKINDDGSCPEDMVPMRSESGRLGKISLGAGSFLQINYDEADDSNITVTGYIHYEDGGDTDFEPTKEQIDMALDAVKQGLCPVDYSWCIADPDLENSFMCRNSAACPVENPDECLYANGKAFCTNLQNDAANCSRCGAKCEGGKSCVKGECKLVCQAGKKNCDGICLELDALHLADCDKCKEGYDNCDGDWSNGCEIELAKTNRKACEVCMTGYDNCDGDWGNGCEVFLDATHRTTCEACSTDYFNCDDNWDNGCETSLTGNDSQNCGGCGITDESGETKHICNTYPNYFCKSGQCVATCGDDYLPIHNACVDPKTDVENCGTVEDQDHLVNCKDLVNDLTKNVEQVVCEAGQCKITQCKPGYANCDDDFNKGCDVNIYEDNANCGKCGNECTGTVEGKNLGSTCQNGLCAYTCKDNYYDCNGDMLNKSVDYVLTNTDGCEVDITTEENCGMCGFSVKNLSHVESATCSHPTNSSKYSFTNLSCNSSYQNCDGIVENGCEVNIKNDIEHCGGCEISCKSGQVCNNGECECEVGTWNKDAKRCVDSTSDLQYCGTAGKYEVCSGGQYCKDGKCECPLNMTFVKGSILKCIDLNVWHVKADGSCDNGYMRPSSSNQSTACSINMTEWHVNADGSCQTGYKRASSSNQLTPCDININNDSNNCGDVGTKCSNGKYCKDGQCECQTGTWVEEVQLCIDIYSNSKYCGSTYKTCTDGQCSAGKCTCSSGMTFVEGSINKCIDKEVWHVNADGSCQTNYMRSTTDSSTPCDINTNTDQRNCGGKDIVCMGGYCDQGICKCYEGATAVKIDNNTYKCVDMNTDVNNCGGEGIKCTADSNSGLMAACIDKECYQFCRDSNKIQCSNKCYSSSELSQLGLVDCTHCDTDNHFFANGIETEDDTPVCVKANWVGATEDEVKTNCGDCTAGQNCIQRLSMKEQTPTPYYECQTPGSSN